MTEFAANIAIAPARPTPIPVGQVLPWAIFAGLMIHSFTSG